MKSEENRVIDRINRRSFMRLPWLGLVNGAVSTISLHGLLAWDCQKKRTEADGDTGDEGALELRLPSEPQNRRELIVWAESVYVGLSQGSMDMHRATGSTILQAVLQGRDVVQD